MAFCPRCSLLELSGLFCGQTINARNEEQVGKLVWLILKAVRSDVVHRGNVEAGTYLLNYPLHFLF